MYSRRSCRVSEETMETAPTSVQNPASRRATESAWSGLTRRKTSRTRGTGMVVST